MADKTRRKNWGGNGMRMMPTTTMKVRVEQKNIDRSIERSSIGCMVNDAFKIALRKLLGPDASIVQTRTDDRTMETTVDGVRWQFLTPDKARRYLIEFDAGMRASIQPFTFFLNPKNAVVRPSGTHAPARKRSRVRAATAAAKKTGARLDTRVAPRFNGANVANRARSTKRRFGARALYVNQIREKAGDIPPLEKVS